MLHALHRGHMRFLGLVMVLAWGVEAWASPLLLNDREGSSRMLSSREVREIEGLARGVTAEALRQVLETAISASNREACAFGLASQLANSAARFPRYRGKVPQFIKTLRHQGLIDDLTLQMVLRAHEVNKDVAGNLNDAPVEVTPLPEDPYRPFFDFSQRRQNSVCLHENIRQVYQQYASRTEGLTSAQLSRWAREAERRGLLSAQGYEEIKEALQDGILQWELSLQDYLTKKQFLRTQFPLPRAERADFVSSRAPRQTIAHRQRLFQSYTPIQIGMMGDVIRRFKIRLDSPRIEIQIYNDSDEVLETISLDPMERFRFAIRILRKEMRLLAANSYFEGRQPGYFDLMTAAFEMGLVTARELDEVARLEEIWNPRQTFWEKSAIWVRMFGSTLGAVLPPPYGFIPSLAIIVIQALNADEPDETTDSLF